MQQILLVEDNKEELEGIRELLEIGFPDARIVCAQRYEDALRHVEPDERGSVRHWDLMIFDIELTHGRSRSSHSATSGNGIDLAARARTHAENRNTWVLFLTGHPEYALDAMNRTHCYDYLVKPFEPLRLVTCVRELLNHCIVQKDAIRWLEFKKRNTCFRIPVSDILYVETLYKSCTVRTESGQMQLPRIPLRELLEQLAGTSIVQCHKSYLINLDRMKGLTLDDQKWLVHLVGTEVTIPLGGKFHLDVSSKFRRRNPGAALLP